MTSSPGRVGVVVSHEARDHVMTGLRDHNVARVDLTDQYVALFADAKKLADGLGKPLPFAAPADAATTWTQGSAVCRARAGAAPGFRNKIAAACATQLAHIVWEQTIASLGVDAVVIAVDPDAVQLYVPGSTRQRELTRVDYSKVSNDKLVDDLFATPPSPRKLTLAMPIAPAANDPLMLGTSTGSDRSMNAGCGHPFPASIKVAGDAPFARDLESAWLALPEQHRTAPAIACTAGASTWTDPVDGPSGGGWLDCAPSFLPVAALIPDAQGAHASARLADMLVDNAVTETCNFEH
ncbi:MAG TPA: hypothetical protein VGO62_20895 [Myxococcota bacterium]